MHAMIHQGIIPNPGVGKEILIVMAEVRYVIILLFVQMRMLIIFGIAGLVRLDT